MSKKASVTEETNTEVEETESFYDTSEDDSDAEKSVNDLLSVLSGEEENDEETEEKEEEEEEEPDEGDDKNEDEKDEVSSLKDEIAELKNLVRGMKKEEPEEVEEREPEPFNLRVSDEQYDKVMASREGFEEVLGSIVQSAIARTRELYLSEIPGIVQSEVNTQTTNKELVLGFYQSNKDLVPHRDYVAYIFKSFEKQNPKADTQTLLQKTAEKVRKDLKVKAESANPKKRDPGFATSKGGKATPTKRKPEGQEAEVAALLELDE